MKNELEFASYLKTVKRSSRTGEFYSTKVASDTISRCKLVERLMDFQMSGSTLRSDAATQAICDQIKSSKMSSTPSRPYVYNELVHAVRLYREYLAWRDAKNGDNNAVSQ